jgi:L-asparaginase
MHFSASAVALALGRNLNFPVVFTGAQTIPDIKHGDARVNLLRAFQVALTTNIAEVVLCFGDYVFRGCRSQKKDERKFDAFDSPAFFPLAHITEDIIVSHLAKKRESEAVVDIDLKPYFASGVVQISLIPGVEPFLFEHLIEDTRCTGIVLQSFGAGNVPNDGETSWIDFIKRSTDFGKPILITSQFPANETLHSLYGPGQEAMAQGAIGTGNMTSACATAKFRWVLALDGVKNISNPVDKLKKIGEQMGIVVVGEFSEDTDDTVQRWFDR